MAAWIKLSGYAVRAMGALRGSPAAVFTGGWLLGCSISSWQTLKAAEQQIDALASQMAAFRMAATKEQEDNLNKLKAKCVEELRSLKFEMDELEESTARLDRELAIFKMLVRMAIEVEAAAASPGPLQGESGGFCDV